MRLTRLKAPKRAGWAQNCPWHLMSSGRQPQRPYMPLLFTSAKFSIPATRLQRQSGQHSNTISLSEPSFLCLSVVQFHSKRPPAHMAARVTSGRKMPRQVLGKATLCLISLILLSMNHSRKSINDRVTQVTAFLCCQRISRRCFNSPTKHWRKGRLQRHSASSGRHSLASHSHSGHGTFSSQSTFLSHTEVLWLDVTRPQS